MTWQITRDELVTLLEDRRDKLLPKLIAKEDERIRGAIQELQSLIQKTKAQK